MSEPTVCAIMLTADRPEFATRAVRAFRAQTYGRKRLVILDSSTHIDEDLAVADLTSPMICYVHAPEHRGKSIGELRNIANAGPDRGIAEILVHFDDDDVSHASRITEQVALLQASGAEAVGYREMLFWREPTAVDDHWCGDDFPPADEPGEAWLYTNANPRYVLGTSLCYWRTAWEKRSFEALNDGEDTAWRLGVNIVGVSSIAFVATPGCGEGERAAMAARNVQFQPRMIASIHAGNTSPWYRAELLRASEKQGGEWKRVPEWDRYCRETMA